VGVGSSFEFKKGKKFLLSVIKFSDRNKFAVFFNLNFSALVDRTNVPFEDIGHIICGQVVQECRTSNIAREAAITAGFPDSVGFFKYLKPTPKKILKKLSRKTA